jgi:archaellum component FlaC
MSASRRLSKLKRSSNPMVSDVSNIKVSNNNNGNNGNNGNKGKEDETLVRPVTILTWHEQRLNKMDETIKNLTDYVPRELVEGLVDTISQLNAKIEVLTNAYNNLIEQLNNEEEVEVETEVKNELNTVKLNIKEK